MDGCHSFRTLVKECIGDNVPIDASLEIAVNSALNFAHYDAGQLTRALRQETITARDSALLLQDGPPTCCQTDETTYRAAPWGLPGRHCRLPCRKRSQSRSQPPEEIVNDPLFDVLLDRQWHPSLGG